MRKLLSVRAAHDTLGMYQLEWGTVYTSHLGSFCCIICLAELLRDAKAEVERRKWELLNKHSGTLEFGNMAFLADDGREHCQ